MSPSEQASFEEALEAGQDEECELCRGRGEVTVMAKNGRLAEVACPSCEARL